MISLKPMNPTPLDTAAKMGQDESGIGGIQGWPTGSQDWLWQDVTPGQLHTAVVFTITEIQHMQAGAGGRAEVRIYGWNGTNWIQIWERLQPEAPMNTPANRLVWYTYSYTIPVASPFSQYRLEFYGKLMDDGDGWKFALLDLRVQ